MEKKKRPPKFRTNMSVLSLNGTAYAAPSNFPNNGISLAPVYQHAPNILLIEEQLAKAIFPSRSRFLVDSKYIDFPRRIGSAKVQRHDDRCGFKWLASNEGAVSVGKLLSIRAGKGRRD